MQLDHLTVPVTDYGRSKRFYADALRPLGFELLTDWHQKRRAYLGIPAAPSSLWLVEAPASATIGLSLAAAAADVVDAFHAAAVEAGAEALDPPGVRRERNGRYYAARVRDPDGNTIEAVHRLAASETRAAA